MLVFRRVSSASRSASSARNGSLAATPCFFSASATRGERMSNRLLAARVPTSRPYGLRLSWPGAQSANPPELMTGRFVRLMRRRDEFGWGRANASRRTSNDGCPVLMALEVVELATQRKKLVRVVARNRRFAISMGSARRRSQPGLFVRLATTVSGATDVFIRRPLSRASRPFTGPILNGSKGSSLCGNTLI
jgi:hypothetical protein